MGGEGEEADEPTDGSITVTSLSFNYVCVFRFVSDGVSDTRVAVEVE